MDNPLYAALREVCRFLDSTEARYTLVGGLAVGIWGTPRATLDVDFLLSLSVQQSETLVKLLEQSGQFVFVHRQPMVLKKVSLLRARLKSDPDISVDFLFADDDFKKKMVERSSRISIAGFSVSIPTPEDLIVLKLLSGRPQDLLDAAKIREQQKGELDPAYIREWCKKLGVMLE